MKMNHISVFIRTNVDAYGPIWFLQEFCFYISRLGDRWCQTTDESLLFLGLLSDPIIEVGVMIY